MSEIEQEQALQPARREPSLQGEADRKQPPEDGQEYERLRQFS